MVFHAANSTLKFLPELFINSKVIKRVKDFNFLGLMINENLSWKSHVDKISKKISKYCGILNRMKHFLPTDILRTIYCSIIQSNLSYSILAWGYDCGRLVKLQKKAIRIITCSRYNSHTEPLFKSLKLLKLDHMLKQSTLNFCFKLNNSKLPIYFRSYNYRNQYERHGRDTRYNYLIPTNLTVTSRGQKCLRNNIPWVINSTPSLILDKMSTHSYNGFKQYTKNYYIDQYSSICNIPDCYSCEQEEVSSTAPQ